MAEILQIHDLRLDLPARRVSRVDAVEGQPDETEEIELARLTFDLFAALVRAAPAALSTEDIVAQVWQAQAVSDETIQQRVSLLRRALGQSSEREYVQTVRGFGYRLAFEPRPITEAKPPERLESKGGADPPAGRPLWLRLFFAAVATLVILLLLTALAMVARQLKRWTPDDFSAHLDAGTVASPAESRQTGAEVRAPD